MFRRSDDVLKKVSGSSYKSQAHEEETISKPIIPEAQQRKPGLTLGALINLGILGYILYLLYLDQRSRGTGKSVSPQERLSSVISEQMFPYSPKVAAKVSQRLSDIKGMNEITEEISNLIKMVKYPQKYIERGAKVPKGLLLYGKPGTGKTMLARAIAGEAGVTFFYCTGSEFDEMFVGMGAKRVRRLFEEAKKKKPCIIFIDEIDTLFTRSRRVGMEHSSSRATINEVLSQMDGFTPSDNILVIGATNNYDMLDPAAIRPGRFDYKIHIPLPDTKGRQEIFDLYLSRIVHDFSIFFHFPLFLPTYQISIQSYWLR